MEPQRFPPAVAISLKFQVKLNLSSRYYKDVSSMNILHQVEIEL